MTDCDDVGVRERLPELMHGVLPAQEQFAIERHLDGCAACREELALLCEVRDSLAQAPIIDVDRVVGAIVAGRGAIARSPLPATAGATVGHRHGERRWVQPWQRVAAAVLVVTGLAGAGLLAARATSGTSSAPQVANGDPGTIAGDASPAQRTTPVVATAGAPALSLGGVLSALSDAELEEMISELDDVAALPAAEPRPILLVQPVADGEGADS